MRRFTISGLRPLYSIAASRLRSCLRRCDAAGYRLVVTAPADTEHFAEAIHRFPQRRIDRLEHIRWGTAYRLFPGPAREAHDRGSWRILAVDCDDRVVGAITARIFCGEVHPQYLNLLALLENTGPVFREHCEMALVELIESSRQCGRTVAEISHWAVAPVWHASLVAVTLMHAMRALIAAFDGPMVVLAADNRRGEVNRLMRLGATPLCVGGHSCLPPFVHHESGAWLRLLVLDTASLLARAGNTSVADLALLQERAPLISAV